MWPTRQRDFQWPQFERFDLARDYFDVIAAGNSRIALRVVDDTGPDQVLPFERLYNAESIVRDGVTSVAQGSQRFESILIVNHRAARCDYSVICQSRLAHQL